MSVSLLKFRETYFQFGEVLRSGIGTPIVVISVQMHLNNYSAFCDEFLGGMYRIGKHARLDMIDHPLDVPVADFDNLHSWDCGCPMCGDDVPELVNDLPTCDCDFCKRNRAGLCLCAGCLAGEDCYYN